MKKILILLLLASSFKAQSNGVWCIPKEIRLDFIDQETGHVLDVYWNEEECSDSEKYQVAEGNTATAEDEGQVAKICKDTPKRPGCFDKNKHGQAFCENFKQYAGKDLEGGTCTKREWDTWKHEKPNYAPAIISDDARAVEAHCTNACEKHNGLWTKKTIGGGGGSIGLCHCEPKKK